MKNNAALFTKALVENGLSCSQHSSKLETVFTLDFFAGSQAQADVALFNDDHGIRITVTDFFQYDEKDADTVLDVLNSALEERAFFNAYAAQGQVTLRKEIPTGDTFSAQVVLETLELMRQAAVQLYEKLCIVYSVLS